MTEPVKGPIIRHGSVYRAEPGEPWTMRYNDMVGEWQEEPWPVTWRFGRPTTIWVALEAIIDQ